MCVWCVLSLVRLFVAPWTVAHQGPWDFPDENTGGGLPLQGIFPIQGSNLGLLHCRWILYHWATWESLSRAVMLC